MTKTKGGANLLERRGVKTTRGVLLSPRKEAKLCGDLRILYGNGMSLA